MLETCLPVVNDGLGLHVDPLHGAVELLVNVSEGGDSFPIFL